jgi:deoxyribonuclease-4
MTIRLGSHVDSIDPIADAAALGAEVVQIFLGDPQSWKAPACLVEGGAPALKAAAEAAGVGIVVHSPYALNVASANNRIRIPSRKLLQQSVTEAAAAGALGVVVHGGHVVAGEDPSVGYANWRKCIDGLDLPIPIFIENTAGGNSAMTRHLESIDRLWDALAGSPNTGRVDVVHCNDSRDDEFSGADRHANLGEGLVDADALVALVRAADTWTILETPGGVPEHERDLAWLRERIPQR